MADRSQTGHRDTVYCHECENEWNRDEGGLTCPRCSSEFTEIVEPDNDPRTSHTDPSDEDIPSFSSNNPFHEHNPWSDPAADPDEGNIEEVVTRTGPNGSMQFTRITYSSNSPSGRRDGQTPPYPPVMADFQRMMQGIMGVSQFPADHHHHTRQRSPLRDTGSPARGAGGLFVPGLSGGTTTPSGTGPRFAFASTARLHPRDADNAQPEANPVGDLPGVLRLLFENLHEMTGDPSNGQRNNNPDALPTNPFAAMLNSFINPGAAAHGDAVYTQEALDRIISQLMDQNTSSNAPGPASEAAIANLPKRTLDKSLLSDEGKAECSICMDEVPIGTEEVTFLPCSHWFHTTCATAWLGEHDTCPICRKGIMPREGDGNAPRRSREEARHPEPWRVQSTSSGNSNSFSASWNSRTAARNSSSSPGVSPGDPGYHASGRDDDGGSSRGGLGDRFRGWFGGGGGGGSGHGGPNGS
ncbi:MAG: hypothetical protein M1817_003267 [Caeruleum heppii]|nr:MAG: hypothetical protein M1817_003267 [Caeruleum heppii]